MGIHLLFSYKKREKKEMETNLSANQLQRLTIYKNSEWGVVKQYCKS